MTTLIEQGILPSPKTSPALHEQRQKLERAKIGDSLKSMIAKRPDRQELVHRHILEVCSIHICCRVWKFHDFSITQILREIKFEDSQSAKSAI